MTRFTAWSILAGALFLSAPWAQSQIEPVAPVGEAPSALSGAQLDQLLGPIALYPDPLISQILPASTVPQEVVMADRYDAGGGDPNLASEQPWDPSVQSLAHYPTVLSMMDNNLAWTTELGQAFQYQPQDVEDSIQRLRSEAMSIGNLLPSPQWTILNDDGIIEIEPTDPSMLYVPVYQPDVEFFQPCYGQSFVTFGVGCSIGIWLNHDFDWRHHHILVWDHDHPRPTDFWHVRPSQLAPGEKNHFVVWQTPSIHVVHAGGGHTDRGWVNHDIHPAPSRPAGPQITSIGQRGGSAIAQHQAAGRGIVTSQAPVQRRPALAPEPQSKPANGAFVGVHSTAETHQFSERGAASRQSAPASHPAPAAHSAPAPAAHSGGGGGKR